MMYNINCKKRQDGQKRQHYNNIICDTNDLRVVVVVSIQVN